MLEIGSRWGSLSLHIAWHMVDVQINMIMLSNNQCVHMCVEVVWHGFKDRIHMHLLDYCKMLQEWDGMFDHVVSVEMIEAVRRDNMEVYWAAVNHVLKKKNATGVIQGITIPKACQSSFPPNITVLIHMTESLFQPFTLQDSMIIPSR